MTGARIVQFAALVTAIFGPAFIHLLGTALGLAVLAAWVTLASLVVAMSILAILARRRYRDVRATAAMVESLIGTSGAPASWVISDQDGAVLPTKQAELLRWHYGQRFLPTRAVLGQGLATRAPIARDQLALRATQWRFDADALIRMFGSNVRSGQGANAVGRIDPNILCAFARLVAAHPRSSDEVTASQAIYRWLADQSPALPDLSRLDTVARLLVSRDRARAASVLGAVDSATESARWFHIDLLNPWSAGASDDSSEALWLESLNGQFRRAGLESLALMPTGTKPFDRLSAFAEPCLSVGPLVSVVMTCFEPGEPLPSAVRSMRAQSWQNWELIIMDDASPTHSQLLADLEPLDPRIRVVRAKRNAGTYVRRNEGIRHARREFVTMQDSDDWVHPRRSELQARHLLAHPEELANTAQGIRATDVLQFAQVRGTNLRRCSAAIP